MSDNKQTKWTQDWKDKNYEQYVIGFPKGVKEQVMQYANSRGLSLRTYILTLIEADSGIDMRTLDQKKEQ